MAKLSDEDSATLERLLAQRDAPDEDGAEIWVEHEGKVFKLRGSHASNAYSHLFGESKAPAKKAAKKAAPPPADDGDDDQADEDDDDQADAPEQDPPGSRQGGNRVSRVLFGSAPAK